MQATVKTSAGSASVVAVLSVSIDRLNEYMENLIVAGHGVTRNGPVRGRFAAVKPGAFFKDEKKAVDLKHTVHFLGYQYQWSVRSPGGVQCGCILLKHTVHFLGY